MVCACWVNPCSLPSLPQAVPCYKTEPSPILPLFLPLSSFLATTEHRAAAVEFHRKLSAAAPSRPNPLSPRLPHFLPLLPSWIRSIPDHPPRRIYLILSRPSPAPPVIDLVVDSPHRYPSIQFIQFKYGNRFFFAHWYSCTRWFPTFVGLSPGTAACRHGRRISLSVPRFPCCPLYTCTLTASLGSHRPYPTSSSPPATSPPARTRRRLSGRAMSRRVGAYS
jgi:hypothetical protein